MSECEKRVDDMEDRSAALKRNGKDHERRLYALVEREHSLEQDVVVFRNRAAYNIIYYTRPSERLKGMESGLLKFTEETNNRYEELKNKQSEDFEMFIQVT